MQEVLDLHAGELVEVRSKEEILQTLDRNGRLDELPFMPEMFRFCGQRFRVYKHAHKTCDFVTLTGIRKLSNAVHLENLRCDGAAHGGCMAACLIFWKEAWLKRVTASDVASCAEPARAQLAAAEALCGQAQSSKEEAVWSGTRAPGQRADEPNPTYVCQATDLPHFTQPLSPWDIRQYIEDLRSGNVTSVWSLVSRLGYRMFDNLVNLGIGLGPVLRWAYDRLQSIRKGTPYPAKSGHLPVGSKTPTCSLNLQPGEMVRVKDHDAILETVDGYCRNRGLAFSAEMADYCGGTYRVRGRISRIIDDKTGKMLTLKNECIVLDGVVCQAKYNKGMIFCPRATFPYWREIWLERVQTTETQGSTQLIERPPLSSVAFRKTINEEL
jgi:hypothetical protein